MPITKTIIDERLFAHINNDAFLTGSALQGIRFARTIKFLNQYIQLSPQNIPDSIHQLYRACEKLVHYEDDIQAITTPDALTALAHNIHTDIQNLKPGEYLLVPGGWSSPMGGHAMIYRYSLDAEGNLLFSINNSGSGLQFHEKKSDQKKELYNPELTYKIPKENIGNKYLSEVIQKTLEAQISQLHQRDKIEAKYLYQEIFQQLSYVKGEISKSTTIPEDHWYTGGQISGTCAQHSLHQMLKSQFPSIDEYRRFIYRFKMYSITQYLGQKSVLEAPEQHDLIQQALKHNLRLLNLEKTDHPGESLFNEVEKKEGHKILLGFLSQLRPVQQAADQAVQMSFAKPSINYSLKYPEPIQVGLGDARNLPRADIQLPVMLTPGQDFLTHMDAVLARCSQLDKNQDLALLEQLESFFLNLPLPKQNIADPLLDAYTCIDSDEKAFAFYQKMKQLQTLYYETCNRLLGEDVMLPRMYVVKMSAVSAIGHVNENHPLSTYRPGFHDFVNSMLHILSPGSPDQSWIANNHPQYDARYKQIYMLYKDSNLSKDPKDPKDPKDTQVMAYYAALLDAATKDTDLKSILEDEYLKKYEKNQSELHLALQQEKYTALYYVTENFELLKKDVKFQPLINKFMLQLEMEKAYVYGCKNHSKYDVPYEEVPMIKLKFNQYSSTNKIKLETSPAAKNFQRLLVNPSLRKHKFNLENTSAAYALQRDIDDSYNLQSKRTDNQIQLYPGIYAEKSEFSRYSGDKLNQKEMSALSQIPINLSTLEERELFHLRGSAACQIRLTLDYFNCHLEKCIHTELQRYIEANIFQPGLLTAELMPERAASFFEQLDAFIRNGLKLYEKRGQLSQASLFFIRLAYQVNQYAAQLDPARFGDRLESFYQQINQFLDMDDNKSIQSSLHRYRFLVAVAQMKLHSNHTAHLNDAIISYFQVQATQNPDEPLDTDTQFQWQCAKHNMMRSLHRHQHIITTHDVEVLLQDINCGITAPKSISGEYPIYTVTGSDAIIYTVNMEHGLVFKGEMAYSATPLNILNHPVMKQLGLHGLYSCFVSSDGKTFLIENPPLELRFIKDKKNYHIQKKWQDSDGNNCWFQLFALTDAQKNEFQLSKWDDVLKTSTSTLLQLADIVKERDSLAWVCCDKQELLITDASHQPLYRSRNASKTCYIDDWQLLDVQKNAMLCTQDTWIHKQLSAMESPEFITVAKQKKDAHYIATLGRYGLQLSIDGQSHAIEIDWEGARYHLLDTSNVPQAKGIKHLMFSDDKHMILVLPIQQFINTNTRDVQSVYSKLEQDTQAKIPHAIMKDLLEKAQPQLWQYTGTEQYIVLKISEKGEPVPQNSAEALYLCYVYLGSNQPEKAWAVLETCDKQLAGLSGSYDDIRYLSWIIDALPRILANQDVTTVIANPPVVACKLKALALLARFLRQDKHIVFPEPIQDERTVNGIYERHMISGVKAFYDGVNHTIYRLYSQMQTMRREMPVNFILSDAACKQLLDFYHDNLPASENAPKALGAMGYEWVRLHLLTLRREYTHLEAKVLTNTASSYDIQRKQDIERFIEKHDGIAKVRSDLRYIAFAFSLPAIVTLNESILSSSAKQIISQSYAFKNIDSAQPLLDNAMKALSLTITDETFLTYFNAYLFIASSIANPYRNDLLHFCQATMIAHRHVPLNKQISNIPLLCNVLYRILISKKPIPSRVTDSVYSYRDLIYYAKGLPVPTIEIPELVDTTTELLMTAETVFSTIPAPSQQIHPTVLVTELTIQSFESSLIEPLKPIRQQWDAESIIYRTGSSSLAPDDTVDQDEWEIGAIKYQSLRQLKSIATEAFNNETIQELVVETKRALDDLTVAQEELRQRILYLAKNGPEDPALKQKTSWDIDLDAGKRAALDMPQLLTLY